MLLAILILLVALYVWFEEDRRRCAGMAPGPLRFPIVGNLMEIALISKIPSLAMHKLAKVYGDVMHLRLGIVDFVVLSSHDAATEFLNSEHGMIKSNLKICEARNLNRNLGIIFSHGKVWQNLRRFTIRTLRDYGFGKSAAMDVVLNEEVDKFFAHFQQQIDSTPERVVLFRNTFDLAVVNVLWRLVSGKSYELNDERMLTLLRLGDELVNSGSFVDVSVAYPCVSEWFPKLTQFEGQTKIVGKVKEFLLEMIHEHEVTGTYLKSPTCLIDVFLQKMHEGKDEEFTYNQLVYVLMDLFQAGSETTSKNIMYTMLYLTVFPQVQRKLAQEIESVLGADGWSVSGGMRAKLPYAYAVILETMRLANVVPVASPRECLSNFKFRGYLIRKNTSVMINTHAINLNETSWAPDPHSFRPERFLGEDGLVDSKIVEKLMLFGAGKRACMGQSLAETSAFVYIVSFLRKFKLEKVNGEEEPSIEPRLGFTLGPKSFYAKVLERKIQTSKTVTRG